MNLKRRIPLHGGAIIRSDVTLKRHDPQHISNAQTSTTTQNSPLDSPSRRVPRTCRRRRWRPHSCRPRRTGPCRSVDTPNLRRSRRMDPHSKSSIDLKKRPRNPFKNTNRNRRSDRSVSAITVIHDESDGEASTHVSAESSEDNGRGHRITGRRNGAKRRRSRNLAHGHVRRCPRREISGD